MMESTSAIHDPLEINLRRQTQLLLSIIPTSSVHAAALQKVSSIPELLATLSRLLSVPSLTQMIANFYRPILIDLCARWLDEIKCSEEQLVAICLLLEVNEQLYPALYRLLLRSFKDGPLAFIDDVSSFEIPRLQRLLLAYYRIIQANRELPKQLFWSLGPLSKLMWCPDLDCGIRLLSIRCYALQSGMAESEREKIEREIFGEICGVDCQLEYGQSVDGTVNMVDVWILPVIELRRIQDERDAIMAHPCDYYSEEMDDSAQVMTPSDLSPLIANIQGVLLLRSSGACATKSSLVPTPTVNKALRMLALHISMRIPTLITSPPSAGKSLLISHLATILHPTSKNQIIDIHLGDTSLDPRSLLGSYISSAVIPGTFEWKEGVLVRSMREGKWVVFEDIDKGSNEVLAVLKPLVETFGLGKWIGGRAYLEVPSRGRVVAHENFMIFATRSSLPTRNGGFPLSSFFGAHKFSEVALCSPSLIELQTIVDSRFPRLKGHAAEAIIRLWDAIRAIGSVASSREVGLRELDKYCSRLDGILPASHNSMDISVTESQMASLAKVFPNPTLREEMYLAARDVFFGAGASTAAARAHSEVIACVIADHLELGPERREWVLNGKTPEFHVETDPDGRTTAVHLDRIRLRACTVRSGIPLLAPRPFAMHRPAILLLSRIASAVSHSEPVLLTGETGTGKTSVISHLAHLLHRPLISLNLSHQTESSDLIGGLKPIDSRIPGSILQGRFMELFGITFSRRKNEKFEQEVRKAVTHGKWKRAVMLWKESFRLASERILAKQSEDKNSILDSGGPKKRRKLDENGQSWNLFLRDVEAFEIQHVEGNGKFAFDFVEGPLVKALRAGDWVLLDEINLASAETLECISSLLHGPTASITLTEHGSLDPVPRHPDFRLFACMNPATDVGKKDLPPNIRSRFTEIDVPPPDAHKETLLSIVNQYIGPNAVGDKGIILNIAEFYMAVKALAESRRIADGSNHRPHFSMRTLTRALMFAADTCSMFGLRRSVWEGCLMAFTMVLDSSSAVLVVNLAHKYLLEWVRNPKSILSRPSVPPSRSADDFVKFGPFYLQKGPLQEDPVEDYILTPSVETKLVDLARIILTGRFPVLIEGPTSSGKTSSVEYLAKRTGHRFIRINNHEHTDIQEYIGSYVSDPVTGKLVFQDGLLVRALRNGDWIVLDELNLAPTDVLEALNRLLDDNRELLIPETQEIVRPHPHFMLFATQNPPGLYAGRKVLSRAFRNRFLEVHFEDVPQAELETILCQRCCIAPSYGKKIVMVFHELQKRRQSGRVFESKHGFATLRDLFRWAGRDAISYQDLADNGYMLLAERTRRTDDKVAVKEVIESVMGVKIEDDKIYDMHRAGVDTNSFLGCSIPPSDSIIWTKAMERLYVLVCRALKFNEPVLLVGETGSGKTSVCQLFADACSQRLHSLNCHQNTETADLIGGLRPIRSRASSEAQILQKVKNLFEVIGISTVPSSYEGLAGALDNVLSTRGDIPESHKSEILNIQREMARLQSIFEWHDGPLIEAMRNGDVFLLDEISLADDSVLERLNSVLEPARTMVLAERGASDFLHPVVRAADQFKLIATMNPGGDYGKKELSPALRNRFTEIWVPRVDDRHDLKLIVDNSWKYQELKPFTGCVLDFVDWLCARVSDPSLASLRDILAWVLFSNSIYKLQVISSVEIFHHAAHMTYLDGLSSLPQLSGYSHDAIGQLKSDAMAKLQELVPLKNFNDSSNNIPLYDADKYMQLGSFALPKGFATSKQDPFFNLAAPTTHSNAMRVVRACQVSKPILLEGSPGVGKTSLVTALANISGNKLCRINLSDQTDLIDLFGSDLPVEGGAPGEFAWKDAEFLRALQEGHWVLLDEMNLAPQAVLEGLNAVLDHRGTVYIPELGKQFTCNPSFRIFAAQNPLSQGGGRKGLPKSFVNRFTKVYVEELSSDDLFIVSRYLFPDFDDEILRGMISFNLTLDDRVGVSRAFGRDGSPWEFNLRDLIRWGKLLCTPGQSRDPVTYLRSVYLNRFRTDQDRQQARRIYEGIFLKSTGILGNRPGWSMSADYFQIGHYISERRNLAPLSRARRILKMQLSALESLGDCVSQSWLAIVTGQRNCGKTSLVKLLADFTGNVLQEIFINSATDTMDILGSFEQVDSTGRVLKAVEDVISFLDCQFRTNQGSKLPGYLQANIRDLLDAYCNYASFSLDQLLRMTSNVIFKLRPHIAYHPDYQTLQNRIDKLLSSPDSAGRFEWVDGPLVQAMKNGYWILLDGANLCNPSVLDRLNSLCEPDGFLTLSERGLVDGKVQTIKPHPNFRLFMSVDPQYGELSRAMRNRGIEIALLNSYIADDFTILRDYFRLPRSLASTGEFKEGCLAFEAVRRGLITYNVHPITHLSSSGRSLDQDSALSSLLDHAPLLVLNSATQVSDSLILFLARALTPAYVGHLNKYLGFLSGENYAVVETIKGFLYQYPDNLLTKSLAQFRNAFALSKGVSAAFVLAQPIDFYLNSSFNNYEELVDTRVLSAHFAVIQYIDIRSALFLGERNASLTGIEELVASSKSSLARKAVNAVLDSIQILGINILNAQSNGQMPTLVDLKLTARVLGYGRYLRLSSESASFDFSVAQAIVKLMTNLLSKASSAFFEVTSRVKKLNDAVSLTSGLAIMELWQTYYIDIRDDARPQIQELEHIVQSLKDTTTTINLRRQIFDVMAISALPLDLIDSHRSDLHALKAVLHKCLVTNGDQEIRRIANVDPSNVIFQLSTIALFGNLSNKNGVFSQAVNEAIELICQDVHASLSHCIWYQHLLWAIDAGHDTAAIITQTQIQWLESLWSVSLIDSIIGPSVLFVPAQLYSNATLCSIGRIPLSSLPDHEADVKRHVRMATLQCEQVSTRLDQLSELQYQTISIIATSFTKSFDESTFNSIRALNDDPGHSITKLLPLLHQTSNSSLRLALEMFLDPVIRVESDSEFVFSASHGIAQQGLRWIAISTMIFDLFIPDAPIDPAVVQNYTSDRWREEEKSLEMQISLHSHLEELSTGNLDSDFLAYLTHGLQEVRSHIPTSPSLPARKDISRLHMFWSEVWQFQSNVISLQKIHEMVRLLQSGDETAIAREKIMQESLGAFCKRLDMMYSDYRDIGVPLKLAILLLRTGLRLVAQSHRPGGSHVNSTTKLSSALVAFPSVSCSTAVLEMSKLAVPSGVPAVDFLLLCLSAVSIQQSIGVGIETYVDLVDSVYEQVLRLWLIDLAKQKEIEEESQSLYRRSNIDYQASSEAEMEEREFLALFPAFEDALEHKEEQAGIKDGTLSLVKESDFVRLLAIHYELFGLDRGNEPCANHNDYGFNMIRKSITGLLLQTNLESLPYTLDTDSLPLQLSLLHDRLNYLESRPTLDGLPYNFYTDANIVEVKRATDVVGGIKSRLISLIQEWPDQMVLHHLLDRSKAIIDLDLHSPIAKVLSTLEQLLLQTEDWEMYSNRENTLKSYQQELIALIVDWRRLELSSWQGLLESQAKTFANGVAEWWFRLYDAIIRGTLSAADQESEGSSDALSTYLDALIPLVDDFISSSPLGQFHARMRLLQSFKYFVVLISPNKPHAHRIALERVRRILHSAAEHFGLFSHQLHQNLSEQRVALEKEIKGFIKLASWKDINVQALKQSAQRTHRQLYKIIRKFHDVLRQTISQRLRSQPAGEAESRSLEYSGVSGLANHFESISLPSENTNASSVHLINLRRTFTKYRILVSSDVLPFIRSQSAHNVDSFAVDIIVAAKQLAALSIPSEVLTEKRVKQQKAIEIRKRKAWSDLLKELKRVGFARNIKPDVLRQQMDLRWIREQPVLNEVADLDSSIEKSENYFTRLSSSLPELRSSIPTHHSDLTTRDLQRGVAFVESSYNIAITLRSRLADALEHYEALSRLSRRFVMLSASSRVANYGPRLFRDISCIQDSLCMLCDALREVGQGVTTFYNLSPKHKASSALLDGLEALISASGLMRDRVATLSSNIKLSTLSVLSEDEHDVVVEALSHVSHASTMLQHWSMQSPYLRHLLVPTEKWLLTQRNPDFSPCPSSDIPAKEDDSDSVINSFLVCIQDIMPKSQEQPEEGADDDDYVVKGYRSVCNLTRLLNVDIILQRVTSMVNDIKHPESLLRATQRVTPFLEVYIGLAKEQLSVQTQWTKTMFKLGFVLCSVMQTLSEQGFCKPPEDDDAGEAGENASETMGGTGLGEGSGSENVSKEIEDESQVEGLQGETAESEVPRRKNDDNDAVEMNEDFGGELEDIPDTSSEAEDESEDDPEEALGKLDALDPAAVDEKLWGDEKEPGESKQDDGKNDQDLSKQQGNESEVVAKEGKEKQEAHEKSKSSEEETTSPQEEEQAVDVDDNEPPDPNAGGAPIDDHVPEANALDLPDDIDLGDDNMETGGDDIAGEEGEEMEDVDEDGMVDDETDKEEMKRPFDDEGTVEETQPDLNSEPTAQDEEDDENGGDNEPPVESGEMDVDEAQDEKIFEEDAIAKPDISEGNGGNNSNETAMPESGEALSSTEMGGSLRASSGQNVSSEDKVADKEGPTEGSQPQVDPQDMESQAGGTAAAGSQEGEAPSQHKVQPSSNPLRSLGDALKEVKQRFEDILNAEQDVPKEAASGEQLSAQLEYLLPDDTDHNMQALGPAGEEKVANLDQLNLIDEDTPEADGADLMDIDMPSEHENHERPSNDHIPQQEPSTTENGGDVEGAILQHTIPAAEGLPVSPDLSLPPLDAVMKEDDAHDVEMQLRKWQGADFPDEGADHIWRLYESLTHDLAYALCEQLRLILEPSLATRLKGDYRTGKRLNMKKIIPYIASDYTKDKIWLRRTKPSQREYQVLIAIDDSRSMLESHSIHLAYETLALISKALSRLESGDIAIAKFGESVDMLHSFEEGPFTDQAGTKVMSAFKFKQKATNVLSLVETSLKVLESARERRSMSSSTAADLWQLEIIISDGMCQDHDKLRTILRKAEEQRVMIVFVILDSLHTGAATGTLSRPAKGDASQRSILSMDKAEFKNVDGRMELQLQKYLDSFPFEYYVVLRNMEALPEVLAGTLKQFFERISEE